MYELRESTWRTPGGNEMVGWWRTDTADWNCINAIGPEDEYHLRGLTVTGLVLDIGGYLGIFGISCAIDNPGCEVTIVEPVPENIAMIRRNIAANGLEQRVRLVEGSAGDGQPVTLRYGYQFDENSIVHAFVGNSHRELIPADAPHTAMVVPSYRIADLAPDGCSLTKIDCEGGEWDFLADPAVATIDRIVGEWHPVPRSTATDRAAFAALLRPTHHIFFDGPEAGPGEFVATRR